MGLMVVLIMFPVMFVVPPLLVAFSNRAAGNEKGIWLLAAFFLSWLGWVAFMVSTQRKPTAARVTVPGSLMGFLGIGLDNEI